MCRAASIILAVNLTLTLLAKSLAAEKIDDIIVEAHMIESPAGTYCYDKPELKRIADYARSCEETKSSLHIANDSVIKCLEASNEKPSKFSSPAIYFGSTVAALFIGVLLGAKK